MNRTVLIILGIAAAGLGYLFLKKKTVAPAPAPAPKALPKPTTNKAQEAATALAEKLKKEAQETLTSKIKSWA